MSEIKGTALQYYDGIVEALVERLYAGATQNERALAEILGKCWMGHTHAIMRLLTAREIIRLEADDS